VVLHAETGSGKTLAYLVPLLERQASKPVDSQESSLILQPNASLVAQLQGILARLSLKGVQVKTPAAALKEHINSVPCPDTVIVDEADMTLSPSCLPGNLSPWMFLKGFAADTRPQFVFCGATFPLADRKSSILAHLKRFSSSLDIVHSDQSHRPLLPVANQIFEFVDREEEDTLAWLWEGIAKSRGGCLVFVKDTKERDMMAEYLVNRFHGDKFQGSRSVYTFPLTDVTIPASETDFVLIGTDGMCRGLDLPAAANIFHYQPPSNYTDYLHRLGRLGRLSSLHPIEACQSVCLLQPKQMNAFCRAIADGSGTHLFSRNRSLRKALKRLHKSPE
jgi:superfamily II DNA/RNA helicase